MKKILLFSLFALFLFSCNRKDEIISTDCYLVGFDPCSYVNHQLGYVLISKDLQDTLITYNFPDTIFTIPSEYYANYENSGYFPSEARFRFRTIFNYRVANRNELIYLLCQAYLNEAEFNNALQVISIFASQYYY